jgi:hypothetical protein
MQRPAIVGKWHVEKALGRPLCLLLANRSSILGFWSGRVRVSHVRIFGRMLTLRLTVRYRVPHPTRRDPAGSRRHPAGSPINQRPRKSRRCSASSKTIVCTAAAPRPRFKFGLPLELDLLEVKFGLPLEIDSWSGQSSLPG